MTPPPTNSHWPSWPLPVLRETLVTDAQRCSYLPFRRAVFRAFQAEEIDPAEYHALMDAGFRRSGSVVYQPMCPSCRECQPIRVPTTQHVISKNQRRALHRNSDVLVTIGTPQASTE